MCNENSAKEHTSPNVDEKGKWYVDIGINQAFPLLHESQSEIDSGINRPVSLLGTENSSVRTFQDWRREGLLLTPMIGAGYEFNEWFSFGGRFGGSRGSQRNERQLLTGKLDADFEYSVGIAELYGLVYPLKRAEPVEGADFVAALRAGRPFISQALSITRFVQKADVSIPFGPIRYQTETTNDDFIPGYHPGLGWEWAISRQWSMRLSGHYSFYFDRSSEFDGFGASIVFAYRL